MSGRETGPGGPAGQRKLPATMHLPVRVPERQTAFGNALFSLGMDYVTGSRLLILRLFSSKTVMYVQLSSKFQATVENSDLSFVGVPLPSWRLWLSLS